MLEPFLGSIMLCGFNFAPKGWAFCNGQMLSIQQNAALFSLLGTQFGGNGTTTFALPDLRGRVALHLGQGLGLSSYNIGEVLGSESATLLASHLPAHTHLVSCNSTANPTNNQLTPSGNIPAAVHQNQFGVYSVTSNAAMNAAMVGIGGTGPNSFSIVQSYLCINFVIATQGIFPSQN